MASNSPDRAAAAAAHEEHPDGVDAHQEQQDDSTSSTGSPTKAQQKMEEGLIPDAIDYWKPGKIDEAYIKVLRQTGWISDFVITKENKGDFSFSFDTTEYFLADDSKKLDTKGKGLIPWHQEWIKAAPVKDDRLKRMIAKVNELVARGLRGEHIVEEFVRRCFFPLQKRSPLAMFGDGPRNPKWLPSEVNEIPEAEVKRRVWAILESKLQPRPEGFPVPYSATNPATEDMFGPDPSEGGVDSTMLLDSSSSSEKEPSEAPKKSSAEAFADEVLAVPEGQERDVDHQSLEQKVETLKSNLMSNASPSSSAPKAPSPPKTRTTRRGRSKSKPSAEVAVQVQPIRPRKRTQTPLLAPDAPSTDSAPELPASRSTVDPGNQVPLSIMFGTLFHGFSRISHIRASRGQKKLGAKKLRVLAGGSGDTAAASSSVVAMPAVELPSGPSPGPAMFGKIKA
ncbi:hypothetical protein EJB05_04799, partial [Eragrostis curvula]